ncbi:hypothetical protein B0T17DRAFT_488692 [Bombardia bombarda]|uniref:Fcf2 pre-rRNA processing C-terminal domain-containing protein n=1 Tax=Bombardia bombarda TaxID=252184 RepID=A0AA40CA36_9PEZI|nr:hypothetical protein B0T17DRAFT_488692 [Bombardia bombarda]
MTTMENLSELDIERLLEEAEGRLTATQPKPTQTKNRNAPPAVIAAANAQRSSSPAVVAKAASLKSNANEKLTVRVPQSQKGIIKKDDAGADWYNMPKTDLTPELKKELQLIRLRETLAGGKRHYKKNVFGQGVPEYSVTGVIQDGKTDLLHAPRVKKQSASILRGVLGSEDTLQKLKKKYADIQVANQSGRKRRTRTKK